ncbi:MAG TPA: hypothetical protein VGH80_03995 [Xanthomonadaceae bacterium]|jgi:hypothetical protein
MSDIDYQWPLGAIPPPDRPAEEDARERGVLHDELDGYFTRRLGHPAIVVPSGQAAIALVLRFLGSNRAKTIFVPRWSSHCLWNVTGHYGNPTCTDPQAADIVLAVHKYGFVERCSSDAGRGIIEDSCDCIFSDGSSLFPNGGDFALVSLPKTMGLYGGGVLVARTPGLADAVRPLTRDFGPLNEYAGLQRYLAAAGKASPFCDPLALEWKNFSPDLTVLRSIRDNLDALERNRETIAARLDYVARHAPILLRRAKKISGGRLPPVLPVPVRGPAPEGIMVRNVNRTDSLERPEFSTAALVPLHFGVARDRFEAIVSALSGFIED